MKKGIIIGIVALVVLVGFIGMKTLQVPQEPVHYHANFAIFEAGKLVDFTSPSLMHITPCTNSDEHSDDPSENVHLHDQIGNVVHVHMDGITWKFFLSTVKYDLTTRTNGMQLTVFHNGLRVDPSYLDQIIQKDDQVLIHIASQSAVARVEDDALLQKESESVGTNAADYDAGKVGIEKCGATGQRNLWQRFRIAFHL